MMKIKLKDTPASELTNPLDVLIMNQDKLVCRKVSLRNVSLRTFQIKKGENHESKRRRRQHPQ